MANVDVRKSSHVEYDAFWFDVGTETVGIERDDLETLLERLEKGEDEKIQDIYGDELLFQFLEFNENSKEVYILSIVKKEEVENTEDTQVFKKTTIVTEKITEEEIQNLIETIQEALEELW